MKDYEFHHLAEEYPLMNARDLGRMEEGMRRWGYDPGFPIILFEHKILDGRNRWLAAKAAEVKPTFETFLGDEAKAREFVQLANEERRHLATEFLEKRRAERVARVVEARQEGKSLRTIAEEEGVSESQVRRDIDEAASTAPPGAVEPKDGKVMGKDGREHPARKPPKPKILCKRCERVGAVTGCTACKEAREAAKMEATDKAENEGEKQKKPKDEWGIEITKEAAKAFEAQPLFDELLKVLRQAKGLYKQLAEHPGGAYLTRPGVSINAHDSWRNPGLETAILAVRDCRPTYTVCPYAFNKHHRHDKNCTLCHGLGWTRPLGKDEVPENLVKAAQKACGAEVVPF